MAWYTICLSKAERGLDIKNYDLFNKALMSKRGWRILSEGDSLWPNTPNFRYGDIENVIRDFSFSEISSKSSLWWRDLRIFLSSWGDDNNWFCKSISCEVGNKKAIDFWRDRCIGAEPLGSQFA